MLFGRICQSDDYWQGEKVRITQIKQLGSSTFMEAISISTGKKYPLQLVNESKITAVDEERNGRNYFHWWIEAHRIGALNLRTEHISRTIANIKPELYQIQAVYGYLLHPGPIRHLLADDPGTGKTIMAIMLMLELSARQPGMRILLSIPPGLISKWQKELLTKFGILDFRVIEGREFQSDLHNPWLDHDRLIVSSYTGRMPRPLSLLQQENVRFDLTIVDEAHRLASPESGWNFPYLKMLSERSTNLLFLTATPHAGKHEQFTEFVNLLVPGLILDAYSDLELDNVSTIMIRRMKEDLKTPSGDDLFKKRTVKTVSLPMTESEQSIYQALNEYLKDYYSIHRGKKQLPIQLIRPTYQRRHASSLAALKLTLERRLHFLQTYDTGASLTIEPTDEGEPGDEFDEEEIIATESEPVDEAVRQDEIEHVQALIKEINETGPEDTGKWIALKGFLSDNFIDPILADENRQKLLIFTEHRETASWLVENLRKEGWKVVIIHGGMPMLEEMPEEIAPFNNDKGVVDRLTAQCWFEHDASICVATDAAGEGIDLQFCHFLINYDMPWNPSRLEQRMGRVHRYGQLEKVLILNYLVGGTIEDDVQSVIQEKLKTISDDYAQFHERGAELVYDVISTVLTEADVRKVVESLYNMPEEDREAEKERFAEEFARRQKEAVEQAKKMCQSTRLRPVVIGDEISPSGGQDDFRTTPEYSENFFRAAWALLGGDIEKESTLPNSSIGYSTWIISWSSTWPDWVKKACSLCKDTSALRINFDIVRKNVLLLYPGVPLFDAVTEMAITQLEHERHFDVAIDAKAMVPYALYFFKYQFVNGLTQPIAKFVEAIRQEYPNIMQDQEEETLRFQDCPDARVHFNLRMVDQEIYNTVLPFLPSWLNESEPEAWLIQRLPQYIADWQGENQSGDRDQLRMLKQKAEQVWTQRGSAKDPSTRTRLDAKRAEIDSSQRQKEKELQVTFNYPEFLGATLVLPARVAEQSQDDVEVITNYLEMLQQSASVGDSQYLTQGEIDRIGMNAVAKYEEDHGRKIKDKSRTNRIGFDILSVGLNEIREIEVKSHIHRGDVVLEENELTHIQQHAKVAWVYVVEECATDEPEVHPIPNLLAINVPVEYYETRTRYRISRNQWYKSYEKGSEF